MTAFCLETENVRENAERKLRKKGTDYIVASSLTVGKNPFGSNKLSVQLLDNQGHFEKIKNTPKKALAKYLVEKITTSV